MIRVKKYFFDTGNSDACLMTSSDLRGGWLPESQNKTHPFLNFGLEGGAEGWIRDSVFSINSMFIGVDVFGLYLFY